MAMFKMRILVDIWIIWKRVLVSDPMRYYLFSISFKVNMK